MQKFTLKLWLITLFATLTACASISQKQPDLPLSPAVLTRQTLFSGLMPIVRCAIYRNGRQPRTDI